MDQQVDHQSLLTRLRPHSISGWVYLVLGLLFTTMAAWTFIVVVTREVGGFIGPITWAYLAAACFVAALWRRHIGLYMFAAAFLLLGLWGTYEELNRASKTNPFTGENYSPRPSVLFIGALILLAGVLILWRGWVVSKGERPVEPQVVVLKPLHPATEAQPQVVPPAVPPPAAAPGWYPDPLGLHSSRWWDGVQWTDRFQ